MGLIESSGTELIEGRRSIWMLELLFGLSRLMVSDWIEEVNGRGSIEECMLGTCQVRVVFFQEIGTFVIEVHDLVE